MHSFYNYPTLSTHAIYYNDMSLLMVATHAILQMTSTWYLAYMGWRVPLFIRAHAHGNVACSILLYTISKSISNTLFIFFALYLSLQKDSSPYQVAHSNILSVFHSPNPNNYLPLKIYNGSSFTPKTSSFYIVHVPTATFKSLYICVPSPCLTHYSCSHACFSLVASPPPHPQRATIAKPCEYDTNCSQRGFWSHPP